MSPSYHPSHPCSLVITPSQLHCHACNALLQVLLPAHVFPSYHPLSQVLPSYHRVT